MKSIDEVYRDFPDEAREKKAIADARTRQLAGSARRCAASPSWLALPMIAFMLAAVGLVAWTPRRPERSTVAFLRLLRAAVVEYETRWGSLPPGDGTGSRELAQGLAAPGPHGTPCVLFTERHLDARGNFILPDGRVVRYRVPGLRGEGDFDLWVDGPPRIRDFRD